MIFTDVSGACLLSVGVWILLPGGGRTVKVSVQAWRIKGAVPGRRRWGKVMRRIVVLAGRGRAIWYGSNESAWRKGGTVQPVQPLQDRTPSNGLLAWILKRRVTI